MEGKRISFSDDYNYLKKGDTIPLFTWKDESGNTISSEFLKGKPVLIILFTAACRHCKGNFDYLEKNLFSKFSLSFNIIAVGRECNSDQINLYQSNFKPGIILVPDPERKIYSKFAERAVPRNYLFDASGRLVISVRGFKPLELDRIVHLLVP